MKTLLSFASSLFSSVGLSGFSAPTISDTRYLDVAGLSTISRRCEIKQLFILFADKQCKRTLCLVILM